MRNDGAMLNRRVIAVALAFAGAAFTGAWRTAGRAIGPRTDETDMGGLLW
jgi:hypothetical protein